MRALINLKGHLIKCTTSEIFVLITLYLYKLKGRSDMSSDLPFIPCSSYSSAKLVVKYGI